MTSFTRTLAFVAATTLSLAALPAFAGSGTFVGKSGHIASGTATVEKRDGGYVIILGSDFQFDGAPDPRVGFGNNGKFAPGTDFEVLRSDSGQQVYKVPANFDAESFSDVYIWCRKFSVPLAAAALN